MGPKLIMVGWVVSPIIARVANLAIDKFLKERANTKLKQLQTNLGKVATVAELGRTRISSQGLKNWVWRFKNVLYDAEDVLDGFKYLSIKTKAKQLAAAGGGRRAQKYFRGWLHQLTPDSHTLFKKPRDFFKYQEDHVDKLKSVVEKLTELEQEISGLVRSEESEVQERERDGELEKKIPGRRVTTGKNASSEKQCWRVAKGVQRRNATVRLIYQSVDEHDKRERVVELPLGEPLLAMSTNGYRVWQDMDDVEADIRNDEVGEGSSSAGKMTGMEVGLETPPASGVAPATCYAANWKSVALEGDSRQILVDRDDDTPRAELFDWEAELRFCKDAAEDEPVIAGSKSPIKFLRRSARLMPMEGNEPRTAFEKAMKSKELRIAGRKAKLKRRRIR